MSDGRASHLARISVMGLRTVSYRNVSQRYDDGSDEWLPQDIIGLNTLIVYRISDDRYSIAGWEPWHDGMFGGRYSDIHNALAWVQRALDIRAGRAIDFLGV